MRSSNTIVVALITRAVFGNLNHCEGAEAAEELVHLENSVRCVLCNKKLALILLNALSKP